MAIIKSNHASNFTILPNSIFKQNLSIEAIGLLAYLISLPHNWVVYKTTLHEQLNLGREKLDRMFKELQNAGYIISVEKTNEQGKFEWQHIVYDLPYNGEPHTAKPSTALPHTVEPNTANQPLQSTNLQSTNNKVLITNTTVFDKFWDMYGKKVGDKQMCLRKWNKLTESEINKIFETLPTFVAGFKDKQYQPFPLTYINQKRWNDELQQSTTVKKMIR